MNIDEKESNYLYVLASQGWCKPDTKHIMNRTFEMLS
jgi:hypothetical protein